MAKARIRIRMYRVGFGDCFLVTLGPKQSAHHVLVDCGVFKGKSGTGDIGSLAAAVEDIAKVTKGKLSLVIATHRHADHIAGFGRHADVFRNFDVGAVWLPIWEKEWEKVAKDFQAEMTSLAQELQRHLDDQIGVGAVTERLASLYHQIGNITGDEPLGAAEKKANAKSPGNNAKALALLKTGLSGVTPQYLQAGDTPQLPAELVKAGLRARILGPPPLAQEALVRLMNLKKNVGQYLAIAGARGDGAGARTRKWEPFGRPWKVEGSAYPTRSFREWIPPRMNPEAPEAVALGRKRLESALEPKADDWLALTAGQLDSYLNNQSLVVLFSVDDRDLLFAGDAQGGNWIHWLYETDAAIQPSTPLAASARTILESLDFYKVGHHGSTNATPIVVSTQIRRGAVALCSTEKGVYGGSEETVVPLEKLMDALDTQCTLVRSDQLAIAVDGKTIAAQVPRTLGKPKRGRFVKGALWLDYIL